MSENKSKKIRCSLEGCKKKITITDFACRCNKIYCKLHRLAESHECTYDFKNINTGKFMKDCGLGGGINKKIDVI
tara:strand:+ start:237 stop:461 length:225 start_codon:yes stop_codon:yes gene_type:complete